MTNKPTDKLNMYHLQKLKKIIYDGKTTLTLEDCGEKMEDDKKMGIFALKRGDFLLSKPPKLNEIISF